MSFRRDFHPLFAVHAVEHGSGDTLSGIRISPTSECQHQLNNFHLIAKPRDFGIQIYYSTNPWVSPVVLGEISDRVQFDFALHIAGDFFARYEPDFADAKQLHLRNLLPNGDIKTGNSVVLSDGAFVSNNDAVRLVPGRFEIPFSFSNSAVALTVRDPYNNTVVTSIDRNTLGEGERIEVDLRHISHGRYRLTPDDQPSQQTDVLISNEIAASRALGIISIVQAQSQQLAPADGYRFEVRFESR